MGLQFSLPPTVARHTQLMACTQVCCPGIAAPPQSAGKDEQSSDIPPHFQHEDVFVCQENVNCGVGYFLGKHES